MHIKGRSDTADLNVKVNTDAQGNTAAENLHTDVPGEVNSGRLPSHDSVAHRSNTTFSTYNDLRIPQYGSITLPCHYSCSEWVCAEFFISDTNGPAILGLPDLCQLRFVMLHCAIDKGTCFTHDTVLSSW